MAELDQRAVGEHRALGGVAVDDRAVLRLGVGEHPAAEARLDARVPRRHPLVGDADGQLGAGALGAAIGAAAERDAGQLGQPVAHRAGARTAALEHEDEHGLGPADRCDLPLPSSWKLRVVPCASPTALHLTTRGRRQLECQTGSVSVRAWAISSDIHHRAAPRAPPRHECDRPGTSAACALEAHRSGRARSALYRACIAGRPDLADAHNNLGRLHHDRGELADAEGCYRARDLHRSGGRAVLVQPRRRRRGSGAARRGDRGVRARDRAPSDAAIRADAHFNLARLLELGGRCTDDELLLRRAVRHLVRYRDLLRVAGHAG